MSPAAPRDLSIYIHWPFCDSKCPYCDFNSHVRHGGVDGSSFTDALICELDAWAARTGGRRIATVFFGGGTPSLMDPRDVARILDAIARNWPCAPDIEVSLEANPGSVERDAFRHLCAAGVNRLSLGVQALDDDALKFLGRRHDAADARRAIEIARRIFDHFSIDLIYARPGQTPGAWARELECALGFGGDHISLYQLTIEPDTPFFALHRAGRFHTLPQDDAADLYDMTTSLCAAHGFHIYEISNYAQKGGKCRHNLVYWRCGDWLPVGPGAHGRLTGARARTAIENEAHPETWQSLVRAHGRGICSRERLDEAAQLEECVLMGLRCVDGIKLDRLARRFAFRPGPALKALRMDGLVELADGHLRVTDQGRLLLNKIVETLALEAEQMRHKGGDGAEDDGAGRDGAQKNAPASDNAIPAMPAPRFNGGISGTGK